MASPACGGWGDVRGLGEDERAEGVPA